MPLQVCFDESGNTGEDLLSPEQPVYVLASVAVAPEVATELLSLAGASHEFHFKRARRTVRGRETILRLLKDPQLTSETVRLLGVHKRFMVTAKMVDLLGEPVARTLGYDLYSEGLHLALSNLWHAVMPVLGSPSAFEHVQATFIQMVREPQPGTVEPFLKAVDAMEASWQGSQGGFDFALWRMGAQLQEFGSGGVPDLDPALPAFVALLHDWAGQATLLEVIHDQHQGMEHWKSVLARLWPDSAQPGVIVRHDGRPFRHPLPIESLHFVDSRTDPRIQLADVIAGAGRCWLTSLIDPGYTDFLTERLVETPVQEWFSQSSIWPSQHFTPDALGVVPGATPYIADEMARWMGGSK